MIRIDEIYMFGMSDKAKAELIILANHPKCVEQGYDNQLYYAEYDTCTNITSSAGKSIIQSLKDKYPNTESKLPLPLPLPLRLRLPVRLPLPLPIPQYSESKRSSIGIDQKYMIGMSDKAKTELITLANHPRCIEEGYDNQIYYAKYDTCADVTSPAGRDVIQSLKNRYPNTENKTPIYMPLPLPIPVN